MGAQQNQTIGKMADFPDTPKGQHERWSAEFQAADKAHKDFYTQGDKVVSKYLNNARAGQAAGEPGRDNFKLNLFHANIDTIQSMMFGKVPEVQISRANFDPDDDVARVAALMLQRIITADIGTPDDQYSAALKYNLQDRLLPGLGVARVRYDFDEQIAQIDLQAEDVLAYDPQDPYAALAVEEQIEITNERAPIEYTHWRDFKWSPCRTWEEMRWEAFRTFPSYEDLVERFGQEVADGVPLTETKLSGADDEENSHTGTQASTDAAHRAEIWEIWCKETRHVYWYCAEYNQIIESKEDPLGLRGFFPNPKPLTANVTTSAFIPLADYVLAQDLYNEIDILETRITRITEAVKVVGVYDNSTPEIARMFTEAGETQLIGVDSFAVFAEKGGLQGSIDWLPVAEVAGVLEKLVARRNDLMALLYQITGLADIMRGAKAAGGAVTATERALEARFASVKIQALQDEFARYATELVRLRAEIVSNHFSAESLVEQSNIGFSEADQQYIEPAIALIHDTDDLIYRIQVKPESVAMVDYAQLKTERTEYINALAVFLQSSAPLVEQEPATAPMLLKLLQWGMAGFKGSQDIEGVLDQAIEAAQQSLQNPGDKPPSDAAIKAQMEQQKQQAEMQKLQLEMQMQQMQHQHDMQMLQAKQAYETSQKQLKGDEDVRREVTQAQMNMQAVTHQSDEALRKKALELAMDLIAEAQRQAQQVGTE